MRSVCSNRFELKTPPSTTTAKLLPRWRAGPIPYAKPAPVFSRHVNRRRQVVHHFAGVAFVGLQQERFGVGAAAGTGAVVEDALGAVVDEVGIVVAGQGLGEFLVVGREIAFVVDCAGISDLGQIQQYLFL